ncbi:MAG TPA: cyclic nucleotide-gated ion channel [Stellaceae bacterium]|jgi:voltage-gated potassium channel
MDYRPLYRVLDPESHDPAARIFRVVHHALAAFGIAIVLAETMEPVQADYGAELAAGFYVVGGFFIAEYLLRLIAAPAKPGHEHLPSWRARALWAVSPGGIFDLVCTLPGVLFMTERSWASFFGFIWASKYVRYSPGLASLGRVVKNERQSLFSVLLGFGIVLLTAASIAYLLEREANPVEFGSIPAALWWAIVTLTTTGYGDVVPSTVAGRILGGTVMTGGILVFALWSGILANGYAQELRRREFLRTWELVAKVPFFHNIGASLIAEVARLLRPRDYPAGAVVMRRGQPGDCMYFIADGEVEIQLPGQHVYLISGQFFGEVALLTGAPRNATVVATQPSTLLSLDIVDFHELLARQPELARIIHEEAQHRHGDTSPRPLAEPALAIDESA